MVLGILLFVYALFSDLGATEALLLLGVGAVLVFLGVGMLARFVVRPLTRAIGAPIEAAAGTTGRLARANATRNPARTAATAAALMIGVGLVTVRGDLRPGPQGLVHRRHRPRCRAI